jgi:hypothetical protein
VLAQMHENIFSSSNNSSEFDDLKEALQLIGRTGAALSARSSGMGRRMGGVTDGQGLVFASHEGTNIGCRMKDVQCGRSVPGHFLRKNQVSKFFIVGRSQC